MRDNRVAERQRLGYQVGVRILEERRDRAWLVLLPLRPAGDLAERSEHCRLDRQEEPGAAPAAHVDRSSAIAASSSPTFSMLNTRWAAFAASSQSQNPGQKSKP